MKYRKSPYKYERVRFWNAAAGEYQHVMLTLHNGKIIKHRIVHS